MAPAKTFKIQPTYCPWCHAPLVYVGPITLTDSTSIKADRYDCAGGTHTVLVMPRLE